jgi:branched-chain amino acid transport system substrate-binding protein
MCVEPRRFTGTFRGGNVRRIALATLFSLALLVILGFSTTAVQAAEPPIKIGWVGPLSGVIASYGLDNKRGVEFAVEQINAKGGVNGRKIEVIYVDTKFDPAFAVQTVQRMAQQDKVIAIIGDIASSVSVALVPVTARLGLPQVASLAGTPKITEMGSKYIFRPYPSLAHTYSALAYYATNKLKYKRFATIAYNDEGGLAGIDVFTKALKETGKGEIVAAEVVPVDMKDFKAILGKLRDAKPEALVMAAAAPVSGLISKQAREMGWNVQLLGHGGFQAVQEYRNIAGPAGDGMILLTTYAPGLYTYPEAKKFVSDWQAAHNGELPRDLEAHGYDQVNILAWALANTKYDRAAVRDQLSKLKDWKGAAGTYTFLSNGDVSKPLVVQTWKDGKLTPIEVYEKPKK